MHQRNTAALALIAVAVLVALLIVLPAALDAARALTETGEAL